MFGVLGIYLLFVGIVLVINGVNVLYKMDSKSTILMNAITGIIIVAGCCISFTKGESTADYLIIAQGLLFGFTYIFIAANAMFGLDPRPFGWFSLFVTIFAIYMAVLSAQDGAFKFVYLWSAWSLLWLNGFLSIVLKMKSMLKVFPYLSIAEGIFAAFIPALLMLTDKW